MKGFKRTRRWVEMDKTGTNERLETRRREAVLRPTATRGASPGRAPTPAHASHFFSPLERPFKPLCPFKPVTRFVRLNPYVRLNPFKRV